MESSSSRSDTLEALSIRGLDEWGGGGNRVHEIKMVFRPRIQEHFHLALPITFPLHTLLKIL